MFLIRYCLDFPLEFRHCPALAILGPTETAPVITNQKQEESLG